MAAEDREWVKKQQNDVVAEPNGPHRPSDMRMSKTDGNASFLRAARAGNLDKVLEYIKNNVDINGSNTNGLTALHLASKEGHVNVVTELLKRNANIDTATKKGNTALHIASLAGQEEVIKILVQSGAKVNVQSQNGFTPLYMAAQENHADVVKYLLANGANQALATEDGFTPLAVALQQGHDKVVAVLLENDVRSKVRLPALHIAAKKDDVKAATLLLQNEHNVDSLSKSGGLVNDTTKSGFTPLHIASHYGNIEVGKLLLEKGADVNFKARNSISPLHVASKWGRANMVQLLLDNHAIVDCKTRDGLTPLHCAARSGHDQVMDLLLERGAPVVAKTKNGLTPLHMSIQGDHVDCARILLYHHAAIDDVTVDYLTPLHVAAHCGNVKTAKLLLDRKCEVNARALNGFTPLHIACKKNRIKIVELLLKYGASVEATTESGLTPLHVASFMGHMNIVIFLIQHGASPNTTTMRGETALHLAARANQTDIIRILLRNGAQVDAKAREQQTALHISARLGNVDNVALLLQHGASVDAPSKDLCTALHIAAKEGHEEVAVVLLDHGAKQSLLSKRGFTPLHIAAKYGHLKVVRLLIAKGTDPNVDGKNGLTPLHVATHYNHIDVALYLLDKGASPHCATKNGYTPLHIAARKNQMDIVTTLVEHGAKTNAESRNGFTPLHLASQEGHAEMVSLLLEHSADVNARAKNGLTALHLAAQEDGVPVAEILVQYHAEIDPQTKAGYTPLHTACHFGQVNMIRFLLDNGASVNATTKLGYTPLHQAAQQGHVMAINILLKYKASPNAVTTSGQTALSIAQRLGYISVVEILKHITEVTVLPSAMEDKYKVIAPETMQEAPMSDSEEEGGEETMLGDQSFQYLTMEDMKIMQDDSINPTKDEHDMFGFEHPSERYSMSSSYGPGALADELRYMNEPNALRDDHRESAAMIMPLSASPYQTTFKGTENMTDTGFLQYDATDYTIPRHPIASGFLVSFVVDARGGAMRGCRHSGVRIIIPPGKACMPTRVTCKLVRKEKLTHPPPLMEGEALASRILEIGPSNANFLGPILIEVPHFASLRGNEREITILRSDNGQTWREHSIVATEEAVQEALEGSFHDLETAEELYQKRITRIITSDFPHYFAIVTRIRQESNTVGPEGGMISSTVIPQVQAIFPEGALTKHIKVGLQAQPVPPDMVSRMLGNRVAVSPIVTVEPRRRKFHRPITLTMPLPRAAQKGMLNQYSSSTTSSEAPTLRLLCSIMGGTSPAQWEDITGTTPLVFTNDCVSFTTTVSARFWLMDCQNVGEAAKMATDLYREVIMVPFMSKFVVFAKRHEPTEARLRIFCMTDDKMDKTLESQEHFTEIARSRDVEVLEGKPQYVEMAGNLALVTKSGDQPCITFHAFHENRLPVLVRVRDVTHDATGRLAFMPESRVSRSDMPVTPTCTLNVVLPEHVPGQGSHGDDDEEGDTHFFRDTAGGQRVLPDTSISETWLMEVADCIGADWPRLASVLRVSEKDVTHIRSTIDVSTQPHATLNSWLCTRGRLASYEELEHALRVIGRDDIISRCPHDLIDHRMESRRLVTTTSRTSFDSSGFDALKDELGSSRASSLPRGASLDVSYDEHDLVKESESLNDESGTEAGSIVDRNDFSDNQNDEDQKTPTAEEYPELISDEVIHKEEISVVEGMDDRFMSTDDAEYELEEVWDGTRWHITKKQVVKKPQDAKPSAKPHGMNAKNVPKEEMITVQRVSASHASPFTADSEDVESTEFVDSTNAVKLYANVVEMEPVVEKNVEDFEETLPDGTIVHRTVTKTTEKRSVIHQLIIEDEQKDAVEDLPEDKPKIERYSDVTYSPPHVHKDREIHEEVLPDGSVMTHVVTTTSQQNLVMERTLVDGDVFQDANLVGTEDRRTCADYGDNGKQSPPSYIPELMKLSGTESDGTKEPEMLSSRDLSSPTDVHSHRDDDDDASDKDKVKSIPLSADECIPDIDEEEKMSRVLLRKQVHKKTIIRNGVEETVVTEDTYVEQDSDSPEEIRETVKEVIEHFMEVQEDHSRNETSS